MKKILSVVLAASMLCGLCSCGKKQTTAVDVESEFDKKLTFSITSIVAEDQFGPEVDYIKKKFNIDFDIYNITEADWGEKVRIWMATGNMPDIMQASINNKNFAEYMQWAQQGLLREIPDLSNYPKLQALVDGHDCDDYFMVDGKRYAWVSPNNYYDLKGELPQTGGYSFIYRRDWAKKVGLYKEGDVYTWKEFEEMARAFKEQNPSGNSAGTIPLLGDIFPHFAGIMQYSPYWEQYKKIDGEYVWCMDLPETTEALKWANNMYKEGILWQDQNVAKSKDATNKFVSGEAGILFTLVADYNIDSIFKNMKSILTDINIGEDVAEMYVTAPDGKMWGQFSINYLYATMFSPKMTEEKMERILSIFEWYLSDEGIEMAKYGMKDYNYTVDEAGNKTIIKDSLRGCPFVTKAMVSGVKKEDNKSEQIYSKETLDLCDRFEEKMLTSDTSSFRKYDYELYFFTGEKYMQYGSYYYDGCETIKRLITAPGDPTAEWEAWKNSVRPKINEVLAELNN
ncbi:MAG: extracellular solute-binding protein [Clostridia bacterium]|nr:extracellular solute-binding protein [Clostridia bacterium]